MEFCFRTNKSYINEKSATCLCLLHSKHSPSGHFHWISTVMPQKKMPVSLVPISNICKKQRVLADTYCTHEDLPVKSLLCHVEWHHTVQFRFTVSCYFKYILRDIAWNDLVCSKAGLGRMCCSLYLKMCRKPSELPSKLLKPSPNMTVIMQMILGHAHCIYQAIGRRVKSKCCFEVTVPLDLQKYAFKCKEIIVQCCLRKVQGAAC